MSKIFVGKMIMVLVSSTCMSMCSNDRNQTDITQERLLQDQSHIETYILKKVKSDINSAKTWGKTAATWFGGITGYTYDSIPFLFFEHEDLIPFNCFQDNISASYIHEMKELFKEKFRQSKKKLDDDTVAEFLYKSVVDSIIDDANKKTFRDYPIKMDEFIRKNSVNGDKKLLNEYMRFTLLNFAVRYYLELELKK
ncbi:MAG TPA: hypothetical protein VLB80_00750 [Candidatus Babeliales bacterium]|nr:hypothetical protein [Candidatus Babeliales bacterium]